MGTVDCEGLGSAAAMTHVEQGGWCASGTTASFQTNVLLAKMSTAKAVLTEIFMIVFFLSH